VDSYKAAIVKMACVGSNKEFNEFGGNGLTPVPVCLTKYPDGGKPCKSSSECKSGFCIRTRRSGDSYCQEKDDKPSWCDEELTVEQFIEEKEAYSRG